LPARYASTNAAVSLYARSPTCPWVALARSGRRRGRRGQLVLTAQIAHSRARLRLTIHQRDSLSALGSLTAHQRHLDSRGPSDGGRLQAAPDSSSAHLRPKECLDKTGHSEVLSVVSRGVEPNQGSVCVEVGETGEELRGVLARWKRLKEVSARFLNITREPRNSPALTPRVSLSPSPEAPPRLPAGRAKALLTSRVPFESIPRS
jgi:hypothetical protein